MAEIEAGLGPALTTRVNAGTWRWRTTYYVVTFAFYVVAHQKFFEDWVGVPASTWFWKANEVYVVALAVPLFWDLVATRRSDDATVEIVVDDAHGIGPMRRRLLWYGSLVVLLVIMEGPLVETVFDDRLPQRIITLRDVVVGLLAVSLYFDWSRGMWRPLVGAGQPRLVAARARALAFLAVLLVNVAIYQEWVKDLLGFRVANALDFHAEAFAVMYFVPLYFDVVLPLTGGDPLRAAPGPLKSHRRSATLALFVAAMLFFLWIGQGAARSWFDNGFGQWFIRSPEPPLAAVLILLYFEYLRRADGVIGRAAVPAN